MTGTKQHDESEAPAKAEFRKITLKVGDPPMKKSFGGCWLVGSYAEGIHAEEDDSGVQWNWKVEYSVALTKQGRIVVYTYDHRNDCGEMKVYDDFEEMKDDTIDNGRYPAYPENVIAATAAALGKEHEVELDI